MGNQALTSTSTEYRSGFPTLAGILVRRNLMRLSPVALILLACACKFDEVPRIDADTASDAGIDAPSGPAQITTSQGPHDFGGIAIGGTSAALNVTIRNEGGETSGVVNVAVTGTNFDDFEVVDGLPDGCDSSLLTGGGTCIATVRYKPTQDRASTARLEVSASPGGTAIVTLDGDALTPAALTTTQGAYDFGDIVSGQSSTELEIVVRNDGEERSGVITVSRVGADPAEFEIVPTGGADDCAGAQLGENETCRTLVEFRPTSASTRNAEVRIGADPGGVISVPVTGDGLTAGAHTVEMPAGGTPLDFGIRELGTGATSTTQLIRVRNTGSAATGALDVTIAGGGAPSYSLPIDTCDGMPLGGNAACDIQVRFNPGAVGTLPATVQIRDNVASTAATVSLTGVGSSRVELTRSGAGSVTSNPVGLNCGAGCTTITHTFTQTPIALTATPDAGWMFTSWSGGCAASNPSPSCSLTLDQGQENVTAVFTQVFPLNVTAMGSGIVSSSTPGILCGNSNADCSETYPVNTPVQLNAEPDAGWEVFAWTGTGTSCPAGARTCTTTMSQARNVGVEFRRIHTVAVSVMGSGQGTISGGAINCSTGTTGACTAMAFDATTLMLTAAPGTTGAGSQIVFAGWGADCAASGSMITCPLSITGPRTVSAGFTLQHRLTLTVSGASTGSGTIIANPGAFACSSGACTRFFDAGTNVSLDATGATMLDAVGAVTGDCTVMPCTLASLSQPRSVTVSFVRYQCVPGSRMCSMGRATECDPTGNFVSHLVPNGAVDGSAATITMDSYQCPMGCHATQPVCADVNASNGLNAALDSSAVSVSGMDVALPRSGSVPAGLVIVDTNNFNAAAGTTIITDADGVQITVPAQIINQGNGYPEILALKSRSFTIRQGRVVEVRGGRALAIVSHFDVFIAGTLDLSGSTDASARVGPGQSQATACLGAVVAAGVGGGGNASSGGNGGGGAAGGGILSNQISPLQGGCPDAASGIGGGGAVQIVSRTRIALASGGVVDLSGGRGVMIGPFGGGGGAGGSSMLEAPTISFASGSTLAARGGSGASVSMSGVASGNEGPTTGTAPAAGVTCTGCGTSGTGGTETMSAGNATATAPASSGGGGSVGQCTTRTTTGVLSPPSGTMKLRHNLVQVLGSRSP